MKAAVISFMLLLQTSGIIAQLCGGGRGNLTINFNGTNVITTGMLSADFNLRMSCSKNFHRDFFDIYHLKVKESIYNPTRIGSIRAYRGDYKCFSRNSRYEVHCESSRGADTEVTVTVFNVTFEDNLSVLLLLHNYRGFPMFISRWEMFLEEEEVFRQQLAVKNCLTDDLPSDLRPTFAISKGYSYGQTIAVRCREKDFYIYKENFTYSTMSVECKEHARWVVDPYKCIPGCEIPRTENVKAKDLLVRRLKTTFKYRSTIELNCRSGRLYKEGNPNYFVSSVTSTCQMSGTWSIKNLNCWKGSVVDFTANLRAITSGTRTIFACSATVTGNKVRMNVSQQVITGQDHVWLNITVMPQHHGNASCEEFDRSGREISRGHTMINVRYPPYLNENVSQTEFRLVRGEDGYTSLEFYTNPTIYRSRIQIVKDENLFQNYYTVREGHLLKIVLHFLKVEEKDYGIYVLTLISQLGRLTHSFTILEEEAATQHNERSASAVAAFALGAALGLFLILCLVLLLVKKLRNRKEGVTADRTYEVVDSEARTISNERNVGGVQYENTRAGKVQLPSGTKTDELYENPTVISTAIISDNIYDN